MYLDACSPALHVPRIPRGTTVIIPSGRDEWDGMMSMIRPNFVVGAGYIRWALLSKFRLGQSATSGCCARCCLSLYVWLQLQHFFTALKLAKNNQDSERLFLVNSQTRVALLCRYSLKAERKMQLRHYFTDGCSRTSTILEMEDCMESC